MTESNSCFRSENSACNCSLIIWAATLARFDFSGHVDPDLSHFLCRFDWPSNIREFENAVERAVILAADGPLTVDHFAMLVARPRIPLESLFEIPAADISLDEVDKGLLRAALKKVQGSKAAAAAHLGISRRAIYSKMQTHGIDG